MKINIKDIMKLKSKIGRFVGARNEIGLFSGERGLNLHGICLGSGGNI